MTTRLTSSQRERLSDLLLRWTEVDEPELTGADRDRISRLRFLLDEADV